MIRSFIFRTLQIQFWTSSFLLLLSLTESDPIDGSPPGSPVPGILQARTLEWVAISFCSVWKWKVKVKSLSRVRLLVTPWTACSPPGSSVHGIFQAEVLEWGATAFSNRAEEGEAKTWITHQRGSGPGKSKVSCILQLLTSLAFQRFHT